MGFSALWMIWFHFVTLLPGYLLLRFLQHRICQFGFSAIELLALSMSSGTVMLVSVGIALELTVGLTLLTILLGVAVVAILLYVVSWRSTQRVTGRVPSGISDKVVLGILVPAVAFGFALRMVEPLSYAGLLAYDPKYWYALSLTPLFPQPDSLLQALSYGSGYQSFGLALLLKIYCLPNPEDSLTVARFLGPLVGAWGIASLVAMFLSVLRGLKLTQGNEKMVGRSDLALSVAYVSLLSATGEYILSRAEILVPDNYLPLILPTVMFVSAAALHESSRRTRLAWLGFAGFLAGGMWTIHHLSGFFTLLSFLLLWLLHAGQVPRESLGQRRRALLVAKSWELIIFILVFIATAMPFWGWIKSGAAYYMNLVWGPTLRELGTGQLVSHFTVVTTSKTAFYAGIWSSFLLTVYDIGGKFKGMLGWIAFFLSLIGLREMLRQRNRQWAFACAALYIFWMIITALPPGIVLPVELGRYRAAEALTIFAIAPAALGFLSVRSYCWRRYARPRSPRTSNFLKICIEVIMITIFAYQVWYGVSLLWYLPPWPRT